MAAQERDVEPGGSVGFERTVAFSDGVFAIAITLLVLALDSTLTSLNLALLLGPAFRRGRERRMTGSASGD